MSKNAQDLSRNIPAEIKEKVRQECGFGCVICGCAIVEYEHFNPEYRDAVEHSVHGIALLCPTCHAKKTRGFIDNDRIAAARNQPAAIVSGQSHLGLDLSEGPMRVRIGNTCFEGVSNIIELDGASYLSVGQPDGKGCPPKVSARFADRNGKEVAQILENEWLGDSSAFDIRAEAGKLQVRSGKRQIDLELSIEYPSTLVITKIDMKVGNNRIKGREGRRFVLISPKGTIELEFPDRVISGVDAAIRLDHEGAAIGTDEVLFSNLNGNGMRATPVEMQAQGAKVTLLRKGDPDYVEPPKITEDMPDHIKKQIEQAQGSPVIRIAEDSSFGPHGVSFKILPPKK